MSPAPSLANTSSQQTCCGLGYSLWGHGCRNGSIDGTDILAGESTVLYQKSRCCLSTNALVLGSVCNSCNSYKVHSIHLLLHNLGLLLHNRGLTLCLLGRLVAVVLLSNHKAAAQNRYVDTLPPRPCGRKQVGL